ncbi:MAG: hypothetical protein ACRD08_03240, partial [Acidimicrobiales bacterium]
MHIRVVRVLGHALLELVDARPRGRLPQISEQQRARLAALEAFERGRRVRGPLRRLEVGLQLERRQLDHRLALGRGPWGRSRGRRRGPG